MLRNHANLKKQFSTILPSLPYLYGLVKTHKQGNPIRPIISCVGSASYKLSKWLVKELTPLVGNISSSSVKNNVDFVEKLSRLDINFPFQMVSFDVTSLFTKVPVDDLLRFLSEELINYNLSLPGDLIIELIKLCIKGSKFVFDGKFYTQKFGMSMGNPLSPVLSNLYMEFFETKILRNILPSNVIWFRYVDDIFCIWPLNVNIDNFLERLNDLVPSIKFTLEKENNFSLPFLDVRVHRQGNRFKFSVYRKPTNISSYIHYYSNHHVKVKQSVFSSMFLRALRICTPEFLDDEFKKIYEIAFNLKYPKFLIDIALKKARKTFYSVEDRIFDLKNILTLPFNISFMNIPKLLKDFNVNVIFKNQNTVKTLLIKNSPTVNKGCIYEIPCRDCDKCYLGQSGKDISVRLKQHQYAVRTGNTSNALFVHIWDNDHNINWEGAREIGHCKDIVKRNIIESSLIKANSGRIFNLSPGLYKLDSFIVRKIIEQFKPIV